MPPAVRSGREKKKDAPAARRFDRLLDEKAAEADRPDTTVIPHHLEGLPPEVILENFLMKCILRAMY